MIAEEIESALGRAFRSFEALTSEEFTDSVRTSRSVVFNSKLDFMLMKLHREQNLDFGRIKQTNPRLFSELLATYLVDLCHRDRIYSIKPYVPDKSVVAFAFEGFFLPSGIAESDFVRLRRVLTGKLADFGKPKYSSYGHMTLAESFINAVDGDSCLPGGRIKFCDYVSLLDGALVTSELRDFIHLGIGYVRPEGGQHRFKEDRRSDLATTFLHFVVRGKIERAARIMSGLLDLAGILEGLQ